MTRSTKPDPANVLERIDREIAAEIVAIADAEQEQSAAIVADQEGRVSQIGENLRIRRDRLAALEKARADVLTAQAALGIEEDAEAVARDRAAFEEQAKACRKVAQMYDATLAEPGNPLRLLREEMAKLWQAADGPTRANELGELPTFINNLGTLAQERLAAYGVVQSRNALFDRDAPPVSVAEHLEKIIGLIAPGPGRPQGKAAA